MASLTISIPSVMPDESIAFTKCQMHTSIDATGTKHNCLHVHPVMFEAWWTLNCPGFSHWPSDKVHTRALAILDHQKRAAQIALKNQLDRAGAVANQLFVRRKIGA